MAPETKRATLLPGGRPGLTVISGLFVVAGCTASWFVLKAIGVSNPTAEIRGTLAMGVILSVCAAIFRGVSRYGLEKRIRRLTEDVGAVTSGGGSITSDKNAPDEIGRLTLALTKLADSAKREVFDVKAALDAHSIVAITDAAGKITYVNDKFCEISRYSREELIGQDHRIINSHHHPKSFFHDLWQTIRSGHVWKGEIRNRAKDGSYYWVDTTIFPFLDEEGHPRQYVAIRTDVTKRKEDAQQLMRLAEELSTKNKELEMMIYVVSHDLRAPLLNVQGFGAALARSCEELVKNLNVNDTPELREILHTDVPRALHFIKSGIAKMDSLLTGFLRYSRIGRVVLDAEPLDMNRLVSGAAQTLKFQTDEAGATLDIGVLPQCMGDAVLLGQVFSNLLDNALKYRHPDRSCVISVGGKADSGRVIYSVQDNGIGIPESHQTKVFELFHRLDPKGSNGDGLGLSISQRIVERHQGQIWMTSTPNEGTTFFIALPEVASKATT